MKLWIFCSIVVVIYSHKMKKIEIWGRKFEPRKWSSLSVRVLRHLNKTTLIIVSDRNMKETIIQHEVFKQQKLRNMKLSATILKGRRQIMTKSLCKIFYSFPFYLVKKIWKTHDLLHQDKTSLIFMHFYLPFKISLSSFLIPSQAGTL